MNRSIARTGLAALLIAGFTLPGFAADNTSADAITGVWETKSGGYVQIYDKDGVYTGQIVGSTSGKARYDKNNPDKAKRDKRLLGQDVLHGLKYIGNGQYESGTIYDPNNGKDYKAKAELTGADTLEVRGYIGISLIGRSQTWHRIDPSREHVHQDLLHKPVGKTSAAAS